MQVQEYHFEGVKCHQDHNQGQVGGESEPVLGTGPFVDGNEETGADEAEDVEDIEAGVVAHADVVDDLGEEDEVAEDNHPLVVAEEVDQSEVEEEAEVWMSQWVQNWM